MKKGILLLAILFAACATRTGNPIRGTGDFAHPVSTSVVHSGVLF